MLGLSFSSDLRSRPILSNCASSLLAITKSALDTILFIISLPSSVFMSRMMLRLPTPNSAAHVVMIVGECWGSMGSIL